MNVQPVMVRCSKFQCCDLSQDRVAKISVPNPPLDGGCLLGVVQHNLICTTIIVSLMMANTVSQLGVENIRE